MKGLESEKQQPGAEGAVYLYCMAAAVADEASRGGFRDFARSLETLIDGFLASLPRADQAQALRLSYDMALGGDAAATPRLRLVYSRE